MGITAVEIGASGSTMDRLNASGKAAQPSTRGLSGAWMVGDPIELGDAWTLRKGENIARCILVTHLLGWELRLMTSDLLRSQV